MTSTKLHFLWSTEAETAFTTLKRQFTSAPILIQPDPNRQFVVEVDASDSGVGAFLSQRSESEGKMHLCAFFSRKLSPAERNYDVCNRELLAVKLALEECRHWLEGAKPPFVVWTDHKNLIYLRDAKRLNSLQARWALVFGCFYFSITYRPGIRNVKPDALSLQFSQDAPNVVDNILPSSCVLGVTWAVEDRIQQGLNADPDPGTSPPN